MFRLKIAISIYLLATFLVLFFKPNFIFSKEGELKRFGTGEDNTLLPLWILFSIVGVLAYYLTIVLFV